MRIRRTLVKGIAPKIAGSIEQQQRLAEYINRTPRPMILFAKKHFADRQDLKGIEIGVEKGDNALSILKELPIEKLLLVDPYVPYEDAYGPADHSEDCAVAHDKLAGYPQVVWLQKKRNWQSKNF